MPTEIVWSAWREIRFASRRLARNPGFLVIGTLLLALGIGSSTAIFGAIDAMLMEPFVPDEEQVFVLSERRPEDNDLVSEISLPHFHDWRSMTSSFAEMAAFGPSVGRSSLFFDDGEALEVETAGVSPTFFAALGVQPFLGRGFRIDEDELEAEHVAVLSHSLWQQGFAGNMDILGRRITLERNTREDYVVVGVMPRGFEFPSSTRLWTPLRKEEPFWPARGFQFLFAVGRLKPASTVEEARAELDSLIPRIYRANDLAVAADRRIRAVPIVDYVIGESTRPALLVILVAVAMLFFISCVNLAGLFLSRALARRKETAIRTALGASRARLAQSFLAEASLLAASGGVLGIVIARGMLTLLLATASGSVRRLEGASIDTRAFALALFVAVAAAVVVTLAPSLQSMRLSPAKALAGGQSGASRSTVRLRQAFVLAEVTLTTVLVVGAALFSGSYLALMHVDLGYEPERLLTFEVKGPTESYPSPDARRSLIARSMERLRAVPGVSEVGAVLVPPFGAGAFGWDLWWVAESQNPPWESMTRAHPETGEPLTFSHPSRSFMENNPRVNWEAVSGSYFSTMRIPLLRGRTFTDYDDLDAPRVVIVSESFAETVWPNDDPIGKRLITLGNRRDANRRTEWQEVVGVVGDARCRELTDARRDIYVPYGQSNFIPASLVLRNTGDSLSIVEGLRRAVAELDPNVRLVRLRTMSSVVGGELVPWRFQTTLITAFAFVALLLAVFGVFGTVSQSVGQRMRELDLRMVLGATRTDITRLIVGQGMRPVLFGLFAGLASAFLVARTLTANLYEVVPEDPVIYVIVGFVVIFVAAVACYVPARRATRMEPTSILRSE